MNDGEKKKSILTTSTPLFLATAITVLSAPRSTPTTDMTNRALLCFFYKGKIEIKKDDRISFLSINLGTIAKRRETFLPDFER